MRGKPNATRIESKDVGTGKTTVTYTGTLEENRTARIIDAKEFCAKHILDRFPQYKQNNAALGLYDQTRTAQIRTGIQAYRAYCDQVEAELAAAQTIDEIWDVVIDFSGVGQ